METRQRKPSEVFAQRLRERRRANGFSQTDLAAQMTEAGRPLDRAALARIEKAGKDDGADPKALRGLSLDEALAFAQLLGAVPAQMLSPGEGEAVMVTDNIGYTGADIRSWLRFGYVGDDDGAKRVTAPIDEAILVSAKNLIAADQGSDLQLKLDAARALRAAVRRHEDQMLARRKVEICVDPGCAEDATHRVLSTTGERINWANVYCASHARAFGSRAGDEEFQIATLASIFEGVAE